MRDLRLREAKDPEIFIAARQANAMVVTKDSDSVRLVEESGPPPDIILLTCGNTSNSRLKRILARTFDQALEWIRKGEPIVEINAC